MKRHMIVFLINIMMIMLLTGCGSNNNSNVMTVDNETDFVAVIANNQHNLIPCYSYVEPVIRSVCEAEGNLAIVSVEGRPKLLQGKDNSYQGGVISIPHQTKKVSKRKHQMIVNSQISSIMNYLANSYPETEEADYLEAFALASRMYNSERMSGCNKIYVFGSGLSTKGLNMAAENFENVPPEVIVSLLNKNDMIPDLNGINFKWVNLCDVDYDLSNGQREHIKNVWQAVITAGGGTVDFVTDPASGKFDQDLPFVSMVKESVDEITWPLEEIKELGDNEVVVFSEQDIGFMPGDVTFRDSVDAENTLSSLIEYLENNPSEEILIAGTTADWGSEDYQLNLSRERANKVKDLLIKAGVSKERIITAGLGSFSGFYKDDHLQDGALDKSVAPLNRNIVIMASDSDIATRILEGGYKRGEIIKNEIG